MIMLMIFLALFYDFEIPVALAPTKINSWSPPLDTDILDDNYSFELLKI